MDVQAQRAACKRVEQTAWAQVGCGMMASLSSALPAPSYTVALGFWGAYCAYSAKRNGRAVFAYMSFLVLSVILDIIYMSTWGGRSSGQSHNASDRFSMAMLSINLIIKVVALYYTAHFFSSIGGADALASASEMQDSFAESETADAGAHYFPPPDQSGSSSEVVAESFVASQSVAQHEAV